MAVGFDGETDPALARYVDDFACSNWGSSTVCSKPFMRRASPTPPWRGTVNKTRLYSRIRPDWRMVKFLNKLRNRKDDSFPQGAGGRTGIGGDQDRTFDDISSSLLPGEGILTRRKPNKREQTDIAFGWDMAKSIGNLDIGQCLVVKNQAVLAVEGIDGTDATIIRGRKALQRRGRGREGEQTHPGFPLRCARGGPCDHRNHAPRECAGARHRGREDPGFRPGQDDRCCGQPWDHRRRAKGRLQPHGSPGCPGSRGRNILSRPR